MYRTQLTYRQVRARLEKLITDGYPCEALVTSVFTAERMLRRTLVRLAVSAGFTSEQALRLVAGLGEIEAVEEVWSLLDPNERALVDVIGTANWRIVREAVKTRSDMANGLFPISLRQCTRRAHDLIGALDHTGAQLRNVYGYDGWGVHRKRHVSALHTDPKVPT